MKEQRERYLFFDKWKHNVKNDDFHKRKEIFNLNEEIIILGMITDNIYVCNQ